VAQLVEALSRKPVGSIPDGAGCTVADKASTEISIMGISRGGGGGRAGVKGPPSFPLQMRFC